MTEAEMAEVCVLLDQLWGGMDEGREVALQWLIGEKPQALVMDAIRVLAREDRTWLPKPPEIAYRVDRLERQRTWEERARGRLLRTAARYALGAGNDKG